MRLSELQSKSIINIVDGKKIGNIIDVKIEEETGKMKGLVLENKKGFTKVFSNTEEIIIIWEQIVKIGEDVILVKIEI